jgi:hypothetical protein
VVHCHEDRHEARLCEWRTGEGPRELTALIKPIGGRADAAAAPIAAPVAAS